MGHPLARLDSRGIAALEAHWRRRMPPGAVLSCCTVFGDPFLATPDGAIHWLNTGTDECTQVAASPAEFETLLTGPTAASWFLPTLVETLAAEGKFLGEGQCYTYAILPIFAEGKYEAWNFRPVPAWEHFEATAEVHRQVAQLPDGTRVRLRVE